MTQIYSAWREIAFGTQELWNYTSIKFDMFTPEASVSAQMVLAQSSMKRCRTLPYILLLSIFGHSPKIPKIILTQPTTLGKLVLSLPSDDLYHFGSLPAGVIPALHTFNIYPDFHVGGGNSSFPTPYMIALALAPINRTQVISVSVLWRSSQTRRGACSSGKV